MTNIFKSISKGLNKVEKTVAKEVSKDAKVVAKGVSKGATIVAKEVSKDLPGVLPYIETNEMIISLDEVYAMRSEAPKDVSLLMKNGHTHVIADLSNDEINALFDHYKEWLDITMALRVL